MNFSFYSFFVVVILLWARSSADADGHLRRDEDYYLRQLNNANTQQQLVSLDPVDRISLIYEPYQNQNGPLNNAVNGGFTNTVPDFSNAGYMGGGVPIPFVPVKATVTAPASGDSGLSIQAAIDSVSAMPLVDGFRGAILLKAGHYEVANTLNISASGVVLRGEGSSASGGTAVTYTSTTKSTLILITGGENNPAPIGSTVRIADDFVPTGATSFTVTAGHGFTVGTDIIIKLTPNTAWLTDMSDMAQWGWTTGSYKLVWRRIVTAVNGNEISVDAPIVQALDSLKYGGADVYAYTFADQIEQTGVENIRLESSYTSNTDEHHGWKAIQMRKVRNSWVRQVTAKYFGYAAVSIESSSSFVTVEDSAMLQHKSIPTGGRRYSFNIDDSDFIMMQRCLAQDGRHDFVSGSRTPGPNVFVDSLAIDSLSDIGPHHRYGTGQLYDNIRAVQPNGKDGELHVQNREASGTGHGWAGAQIMFWNNEGSIICDAPNNAMNWAVGNRGKHSNSTRGLEKNGIHQSIGTHVTPRSLYYAQLKARLGPNALHSVIIPAQKVGPVWTQLNAWHGDGLFLDPLVCYVDEESLPAEVGGAPLEIGGIVRDIKMLDNTPTFSWSQVSGPGVTTFADATALFTTVLFSSTGTYVLQLVATDDSTSTTHVATIRVGALAEGDTFPPSMAPTQSPTTTPTQEECRLADTLLWPRCHFQK